MLNVYFAHWPVEATLGEAMWGIFGGGYFSVGNHQQLPCLYLLDAITTFNHLVRSPSGVNLQVATLCNTYISDITSQSDRTSRISLLDAFVMLAMPFGNLIGARLYLHFGYYITFAASGFFAISGAVYVVLVLKETVVQGPREEKERQSICQVPQSQIINEGISVPDAGGEEPSDDGEVSDEASKWVEKGVASLLLLYACRSQSFLQGIFHWKGSTVCVDY